MRSVALAARPREAGPPGDAPPAATPAPAREERGAARAATLVLAAVLVAWAIPWLAGNRGMLLDPLLQNDDARTHLIAFHRFEAGHPLADDPVAARMADMMAPGVALLYRLLVPACGLLVAAKIVQALCFALVVVAALVVARTPRAGPAAAALLLFGFFHDTWIVNRTAGGLQRSFGFPLLALWLAGALAERRNTRAVALVLAALTYPMAMLLGLGAEAVLAATDPSPWRPRVLGTAGITIACAVALLGPTLGHPRPRVQTLPAAAAEPALGPSGRHQALPFPPPLPEFAAALAKPFGPQGTSPVPALGDAFARNGLAGAVLALGLVLLPVVRRRAPAPRAALALLLSAVACYAVARTFAFRFYRPDRYYAYGMPMVALALVVGGPGLLLPEAATVRRAGARSLAALAVIAGLWLCAGNGVVAHNGVDIDRREHAALYDVVAALPPGSRIAAHPGDGDDIPLWSARPTMIGMETLQAWFVDDWAWLRARAEDTLRAMYATDRAVFLAFCARHGVTHVLIRDNRYGPAFRQRASLFEPLGSVARALVAGVPRDELVLTHPPAAAVVFRDGMFTLLSVEGLQHAWGDGGR